MTTLSYDIHEDFFAWLGGTDFPTAPTGLKLGLLTVAPNPDGTGVTEPSGGDGYARQVFSFGSTSHTGGVTTAKNAAPLVFGPATGDWPSLTYAAIFDTASNMIAYSPLPASRVCVSGDSISFGANALQLRMR